MPALKRYTDGEAGVSFLLLVFSHRSRPRLLPKGKKRAEPSSTRFQWRWPPKAVSQKLPRPVHILSRFVSVLGVGLFHFCRPLIYSRLYLVSFLLAAKRPKISLLGLAKFYGDGSAYTNTRQIFNPQPIEWPEFWPKTALRNDPIFW